MLVSNAIFVFSSQVRTFSNYRSVAHFFNLNSDIFVTPTFHSLRNGELLGTLFVRVSADSQSHTLMYTRLLDAISRPYSRRLPTATTLTVSQDEVNSINPEDNPPDDDEVNELDDIPMYNHPEATTEDVNVVNNDVLPGEVFITE